MSRSQIPVAKDPGIQPLEGHALWLGFAACATAPFMNNLDSSIVSVVLPVLSHQFSVPITTLQWVVSAYLIVITGLIPAVSKLGDAIGRREVFFGGVFVFSLGSLLCALSPNFAFLVAARILQGVGASVTMSINMAIIAMIFPVSRRGQALGYAALLVAVGTLLGPPLGGFLSTAWGWRSIFWVNLPVGAWTLWGAMRFLPHFPGKPDLLRRFDIRGAFWFIITSTLLQIGLTDVMKPLGWGLLAAAGAAGYTFIRNEGLFPRPVIPLPLFRIAAFSRVLLSGLFYRGLLMFPSFLLPLFLHEVQGRSEGWIGLMMLVQAVTMVVMAPVGGWLADHGRGPLAAHLGLAMLLLSNCCFFALSAHTPAWLEATALAGAGVGAGLFNSPTNVLMLNAVPGEELGTAAGLGAVQRGLGRSLGVVLLTLALSVSWMVSGIGPVLALGHADYAHWFLVGMHGAFGLALVVNVGAILLLPRRRRAAA